MDKNIKPKYYKIRAKAKQDALDNSSNKSTHDEHKTKTYKQLSKEGNLNMLIIKLFWSFKHSFIYDIVLYNSNLGHTIQGGVFSGFLYKIKQLRIFVNKPLFLIFYFFWVCVNVFAIFYELVLLLFENYLIPVVSKILYFKTKKIDVSVSNLFTHYFINRFYYNNMYISGILLLSSIYYYFINTKYTTLMLCIFLPYLLARISLVLTRKTAGFELEGISFIFIIPFLNAIIGNILSFIGLTTEQFYLLSNFVFFYSFMIVGIKLAGGWIYLFRNALILLLPNYISEITFKKIILHGILSYIILFPVFLIIGNIYPEITSVINDIVKFLNPIGYIEKLF